VYDVVDGLLERHQMHSELPDTFTIERGEEVLEVLAEAGLQLCYLGEPASPADALAFLRDWCESADIGRDGLTSTGRRGFTTPPAAPALSGEPTGSSGSS
jgi:hypothetical protein